MALGNIGEDVHSVGPFAWGTRNLTGNSDYDFGVLFKRMMTNLGYFIRATLNVPYFFNRVMKSVYCLDCSLLHTYYYLTYLTRQYICVT